MCHHFSRQVNFICGNKGDVSIPEKKRRGYTGFRLINSHKTSSCRVSAFQLLFLSGSTGGVCKEKAEARELACKAR